MFAHPDESTELGARELRTTPAFARRALDDTARMDVLARDLSLGDASLKRVFDNVQAARLLPPDTTYDRTRFVDESFLLESRK
jgi:NitT/TauT family transport system substrate-binding protein